MSPFLERGTRFNEDQYAKYVTVGDGVYYSDAKGDIRIGLEEHATLAKRAGATTGSNGKRLVDDAGRISFRGGKFDFGGSSSSVETKNDKEKTRSLARSILGEDKVT